MMPARYSGWRARNSRTQGEVAALLHTTQQHLSQMENGTRPLTLELRRTMVAELGISSPRSWAFPKLDARAVAGDHASPEIATSRMQWRAERRWLNQHRSTSPAWPPRSTRRSTG